MLIYKGTIAHILLNILSIVFTKKDTFLRVNAINI